MVWNANTAPAAGTAPDYDPGAYQRWLMANAAQQPAVVQAQAPMQGGQIPMPPANQQAQIPLGPVPNAAALPTPAGGPVPGSMGPQQAAASNQILPARAGGLQLPLLDGSGGSRTLVPFALPNGQTHVMDIQRPNRAAAAAGDAGYGPLGDMPDPRSFLQNSMNQAINQSAIPAQAQNVAGQLAMLGGGGLAVPAPQSQAPQGNLTQDAIAQMMGKYAPQSQGQVQQARALDLQKGENNTKLALGAMSADAQRNSTLDNNVAQVIANKDMSAAEKSATIANMRGQIHNGTGQPIQQNPFVKAVMPQVPNAPPGVPAAPAVPGKTPEELNREQSLANQTKAVIDEASVRDAAGHITKMNPQTIFDRISKDTRLQDPAAIQDIVKQSLEQGGTTPEAFKQAMLLHIAKAARNSGLDLTKPQAIGNTGMTLHQPASMWDRNLSISGPGVQANVQAGRPWLGGLPGFFAGQDDIFPTTKEATKSQNMARTTQGLQLLQALQGYQTNR